MRASLSLALPYLRRLCLGLWLGLWLAALPGHALARTGGQAHEGPGRALPEPRDTALAPPLVSDGTGPIALAKSGQDTFWIYGGPRSLEGRFQTANGSPDPQGWIGADLTDIPNHWQVSSFNAETLGGHGTGNHAVWCGMSAEQVSGAGWVTPPGYGNRWNDVLIWTSPPLLDPSVGQTVELDFNFHHDLEPGYDFFTVEYDSAGFAPRPGGYYTGGSTSGRVYATDGTNADAGGNFAAPGVRFSDVQLAEIRFSGGDYGGDERDRIVHEWMSAEGDRKIAMLLPLRPGEGAGNSDHPGGVLPTTALVRELLLYAESGLEFGTPTSAPRVLPPRLTVSPTPFNPRTTIALVIPQNGATRIQAFDVRGRLVRTLFEGDLAAGTEHRLAWDGRDDRGAPLASGVYYVVAEAPRWSERQKVLLLK